MPLPIEYFKDVHGFISWPEAQLLYRLATEVSLGGNIVEIGSYQARSTIALALGAKEVGGVVWAIDHHPTYEAGGTHYGMGDNQAYYGNLADYGVGEAVKTINLSSDEAFVIWKHNIDLLFIDGNHEYEQVHKDWYLWSHFAKVVALHDTAGYHAGVTRLVESILTNGLWVEVTKVDSITVFQFRASMEDITQ